MFSRYSDNNLTVGFIRVHIDIIINRIVILFIFNIILSKSLIRILNKINITPIMDNTNKRYLNSLFFDFREFILSMVSFIVIWLKHAVNTLYRLNDKIYGKIFLLPTI